MSSSLALWWFFFSEMCVKQQSEGWRLKSHVTWRSQPAAFRHENVTFTSCVLQRLRERFYLYITKLKNHYHLLRIINIYTWGFKNSQLAFYTLQNNATRLIWNRFHLAPSLAPLHRHLWFRTSLLTQIFTLFPSDSCPSPLTGSPSWLVWFRLVQSSRSGVTRRERSLL